MIPNDKLVELASLYEEYMYSPDPFAAGVKAAKTVFDAECKKLYEGETVDFRRKMPLENYVATVIVVAINRYLDQPQTRYPAI